MILTHDSIKSIQYRANPQNTRKQLQGVTPPPPTPRVLFSGFEDIPQPISQTQKCVPRRKPARTRSTFCQAQTWLEERCALDAAIYGASMIPEVLRTGKASEKKCPSSGREKFSSSAGQKVGGQWDRSFCDDTWIIYARRQSLIE